MDNYVETLDLKFIMYLFNIREVISLMVAQCSWKNVENLEEFSIYCIILVYLVSALVIRNLWYIYFNSSQQHSGTFLTWTKLALSWTVTRNFMALDMTINSNPLLNINIGEYGRYCLKTIYQIGTVVLYVIKILYACNKEVCEMWENE